VTVLRDITESKRTAQVKARFMNLVAHELRAPLSAIDAYLSAIDDGYVQDREKQHEIIGRSKQRIKALVDLVGDLLSMARMEEGTVRQEILPLAIFGILQGVKELMQPIADRKRVGIELAASDNLPEINADREELARLFSNLVDNAVKYNKPDGQVRIAADLSGAYVRVCIADTGIGIGKEGLGRLFAEFFREKREETSLITGTGLGLSIVKRIVDFYQGRIEVDSEPGKGSIFTVWLPWQSGADAIKS
jgi:signal transduction histidine kinase